MQKVTTRLLGGGAGKGSRTSASLTVTSPGSGPRTHLPFLLNVVKKAQSLPSTAGTASPYRVYPQLPAGASKQAEGSAILFKDGACVIVNDAFPKSHVHCLVMPLDLSLRSLNDLHYDASSASTGSGGGQAKSTRASTRKTATGSTSSSSSSSSSSTSSQASDDGDGAALLSNGLDHLQLLQHCDAVAQQYVAFLRQSNPSAYGRRRFITGFHALPSLPMLHMHLVSMDLNSPCLKTKKHYNSFATFFFLTADRVMDDLRRNGRVTINQNVTELDKMENQPMTCLWCGAAQATVPAMKKHVAACPKNKFMAK